MPRKQKVGSKRSSKTKSNDVRVFKRAFVKALQNSSAAVTEETLDPDDVPELTEDFLQQADWYIGKKLIRRGRPPGPVPKRPVTIRLDADIVAHFQKSGAGWQSRMNSALRQAAGLPMLGNGDRGKQAKDDEIYAQMDTYADTLPASSTFWDDARIEFRQILKSYRDFSPDAFSAQFDRWRAHYQTKLGAEDDQKRAHVTRLLAERDDLQAWRRTLSPGPEREVVEKRLWAIGQELGDLITSGRPLPRPAKWASDEET